MTKKKVSMSTGQKKSISIEEGLKRLIEEGTWEKDFKLTPEERAQFKKMKFAEETSKEKNFVIGGRVKQF